MSFTCFLLKKHLWTHEFYNNLFCENYFQLLWMITSTTWFLNPSIIVIFEKFSIFKKKKFIPTYTTTKKKLLTIYKNKFKISLELVAFS